MTEDKRTRNVRLNIGGVEVHIDEPILPSTPGLSEEQRIYYDGLIVHAWLQEAERKAEAA